ncbi:hypothetical protein [Paenibacillus sp. NAIST15-1]|uniref:hypothetical protein n=1 Tax=Paenibacillus sp. NAIST15-1 TaxID=1605994 RepID=UPI00086C0A5F|nr:hypothetical protein [Paenibacillus sp. NAIST15-1]GAV11443.1 hypothetical protein PBN151_1372 [Paenibacillus sp. NAIST15-1]
MSKYELSLSRDYVPDWTLVDAIRELFQNALDQQTTMPDNEMFFSYKEDEKKLYIGNKSSVLSVKSLLLGKSTKRNEPNTIGKFGEGYKVATLVLTRLNKCVTFFNYGAREVWRPRFVNSRRYGCEILTFFIDKKYIWQRVPDMNLTIEIDNISPEEYSDIVASNLHCQDVGKVTHSECGRILHESRYKGKVFVNGLFVCDYIKYEEGYDFRPQYLRLDRDRKLADNFELEWLSSRMWRGAQAEKAVELIKRGCADVAYFSSVSFYSPSSTVIDDIVFEDFKKEHGENAIPVTTQDEYVEINSSPEYRPVIVSQSYCNVIKSSSKYEPPVLRKIDIETSKAKIEKWLEKHKQSLSKKAILELQNIIEEVSC